MIAKRILCHWGFLIASSFLLFTSCTGTSDPSVLNDFKRVVVDTNPPVTPLSPEESMSRIQLPPRFSIQLVAAEPMVQEPVALAWDGDAKMYVAEMNTYMKDADATGEFEPLSRIKLLEDTNYDGRMDKYTIFIDSLVLPRTILPVGNELFVTVTNERHVWSYKDTDGDGKADTRKMIFRNDEQDVRNLEHQNGGFLWNLDNWIYPSRDNLRYKFKDGKLIADTMVDNMIGQWGMTSDDYGRLFYSEAGPGLPAVQIQQLPAYGSLNFADQYSESFTRPWPIIGTLDAQSGRKVLREEDNTLHSFTSGCGQSIFRGDRMPAEMKGDYFIAEPVGRIIKRGKVHNRNGKIFIEDVYDKKDWLASADMNFRPINTYTGPDGSFYIVNMYHGIIQESEWTTPDSYLGQFIKERELYKNRGMGRIYKVVHEDHSPDTEKPAMLKAPSSQLVQYLAHPNGWWRDMAQQLLVLRNDHSVSASLEKMALDESQPELARIHAMWTLEGMNAVKKETLLRALKSNNAQVRRNAVWISEPLIRKKDQEITRALLAMREDENANVKIQLMLSMRTSSDSTVRRFVRELVVANEQNEMMQFSYSTFVNNENARQEELQRTLNLRPEERKLVSEGATIFSQLCASCHGINGRGVKQPGRDLPAPVLAGSPRVRGDKITLTQLLLNGLKGPVDGQTYPDIMPGMSAQSDEWIASVLSYIRNSNDLGNTASIVTPEEVAEIRANTPKIPGGMTLQQLEIFKLGRAERNNWDAPANKPKRIDSTNKK